MSTSWTGLQSNPFQTSSHEQSGSECTLTPSALALSVLVSAYIGSFINGLANGWLVAFTTGWISWLALFRVLLGGVYMLYRSLTDS
ncbi:hypothetical protein C8A05DRAFT_39817, partial [Staphylotrichum tortipilum]